MMDGTVVAMDADVHLFGIWAKDLAKSLTSPVPFMQIELLMVDDTVIATDDDVHLFEICASD
jgi:hypothetical protein